MGNQDFYIKQFDPFQLEIPKVKQLSGTIRVIFPKFHVKFLDLSMGNIIPGAHVGADGEVYCLTIDLGDSTIETTKIIEMIMDEIDLFRDAYDTIQKELDKTFLLEKKK